MSEKQPLPGTMREVMEQTPAAFIPEKAEGVNATIQYRFSGDEPGSWVVRIADGKCTVEEGEAEKATITIKSASEVWLKILKGEIDGTFAYMTGKFKVDGPMSVLMQMRNWFGM